MKRYLIAVAVGTLGTVTLKIVYDKFLAQYVPDKVLIESLDLDTDDLALSALVGAALPIAIIPLIRTAGGKTGS